MDDGFKALRRLSSLHGMDDGFNMISTQLRPCLDEPQKLEFLHSLSITSIFRSMHRTVNIDKKITCTV
jgi:hypothetical protein